MECAVCGGEVEPIYRGSGICGSCGNLLGEMGPSGLEALSRCQKRYASQKELIEKLKTVNHRQAEDISELDLAYKNSVRDRELLEGEVAGLKNVDIPTFQRALEQAKVDKDCCCAGTEVLRVKLEQSLLQVDEMKEQRELANAQIERLLTMAHEKERLERLLGIARAALGSIVGEAGNDVEMYAVACNALAKMGDAPKEWQQTEKRKDEVCESCGWNNGPEHGGGSRVMYTVGKVTKCGSCLPTTR